MPRRAPRWPLAALPFAVPVIPDEPPCFGADIGERTLDVLIRGETLLRERTALPEGSPR